MTEKTGAELNNTKVTIIGNTSRHGIPIGKTVTIHRWSGGAITGGRGTYLVMGYSFSVAPEDFIATAGSNAIKEVKDELNNQIEDLKGQLKHWNEVMTFMKENNQDEFDEDAFKAFQILKTLGDDASDIDKANAIAKIVKQGS